MLRIALALLVVTQGVLAQPLMINPAERNNAPVTRTAMTWMAMPGLAHALAIGGDGAVFALDAQGLVWLRRPGTGTAWVMLPGKFRRIAAASATQAWALDDRGEVFTYTGTWWRPMGKSFPIEAVDIGASIHGTVFAVTTAGRLVMLDPLRGVLEVPDAPKHLVRVVVDDSDLPWTVDHDGVVRRFSGGRWVAIAGQRARDIQVSNGAVWLIGLDHGLIALGPEGTDPRPTTVNAALVASAPGGKPWIATADGRIYVHTPQTPAIRGVPRAERRQVFTELINWQRVRGSARQLAISPKGAVLALGSEGEIWFWRSRNNWGRLPGRLERVALDSDNIPWGIAADGKIKRYQGNYWEDLPGRAREIAAGADGSVWIVGMDGMPARWQPRRRSWQALDTSPNPSIQRIAVAGDGTLWSLDKTGIVARFDGKQWEALPEMEIIDFAISPEGSLFVVSADKSLSRWYTTGKRWERLNGEAVAVSVGPRGKPWIIDADKNIFASDFFDELPDNEVNTVSVAAANAAIAVARAGIGQPATTQSGVVGLPGSGGVALRGRLADSLSFLKVAGTARDISIGADGSIFVVGFDGGLARWSNTQNRFLPFPGQFTRIAVSPEGNPWGVTSQGEVFRHDGGNWRVVLNIKAQDIAIGFDGTVIVSGPQDFLYRYNKASDGFLPLPADDDGALPRGVKVAVDASGKSWVVRRDSIVARCDRTPCEALPQQARDISIGPEGSIFIVDMNRSLRRWNERLGEFEFVFSIADLIDVAAVGPMGKPWLISTQNEVWASEFFRRDEDRDVAKAVTSLASTSTSGTTAFSFTVNMPFDRVQAGFFVNVFPGIRLAIGTAGKLVAIDTGYAFWNYDDATKRMVRDPTVPSPASVIQPGDSIRAFVVDKDGTYWLSNNAFVGAPNVYRRQGGLWVAVAGLSDCAITPVCGSPSPMSLTVGHDGTVYATSEANFIYRYDLTLRRFVKLTLPLPSGGAAHIAIDPAGQFWVTSPFGQLYEYQGNSWTARQDASWCIASGGTCVSIGSNGSVYAYDDSAGKLMRWNSSARVWETISSSPNPLGHDYVIAPDGRPWVFQELGAPPGPGLYRAR